MMEDWLPVWENRGLLLSGMWFTVRLGILCIAASTALGFLVALAQRTKSIILNALIRIYVEIFRGSPVLIQILFVFYGASYLRISGVSAFFAAGIALTLFSAAHISEVFRAGLESVPGGLREAGRTLGLSGLDTLRFVVFPLAMRVSLPPLFGQYLTLVKNTALASIIGYADLMRQAQGVIARHNNPFHLLLIVSAFYFIICYPLSRMARVLERRSAT